MNLLWLSLCSETPGNFIMKRPCDSHVTVIWKLQTVKSLWSLTIDQATSNWNHLTTLKWPTFRDSTVNSLLSLLCDKPQVYVIFMPHANSSQSDCYSNITASLQMMVTWESPGAFIVTSHNEASQNKSHYAFTVEPPKLHNHLKVIMRWIKILHFGM